MLGEKSAHGRGGMGSKIQAAWYGAQSGASVVITNGKYPELIVKIILGEKVGTLFNTKTAEAIAINAQQSHDMQARSRARLAHQHCCAADQTFFPAQ